MKKLQLTLLTLLISVTTFATISPIVGPANICAGDTVIMTDATPGGTWSSSNPALATIGSSSGVVIGVSAGNVTLTYTVSGSYVTSFITINALPTLYTVTGGGHYCAGSAGAHVGLNGSNVGISYQLYLGTSPVGTPISGTGAALDFGLHTTAGTYTVVATNMVTGCTVTMSLSVTITIDPLPAIDTITGGGGYCPSGAGVHIGLTGSQAGINYQLHNGTTVVGGPIVGTGLPVDFGLITPGGTYTVVATNTTTGCTATMYGSATVTLVPSPTVYTLSGSGSFCAGTSGGHVTLSGSDTGVTYTLDSTGITIMTLPGTGAPLDFGYHTGGSFVVVATNATGCMSAMSPTVSITIMPTVTPAVSIAATPGTSVPSGTFVNFAAIAVNGGSSPTYTWFVNGTSVGAGSTYSYLPANGDVVTLCMASSAPCAVPTFICTSDTMTVTTTTSINAIAINNTAIYPNPATDELIIKTDGQAFRSFTITNNIGQIMMQQNIAGTQTTVDVRSLPAGMYYLTMHGDSGNTVRKFVKL